MKRQQKILYAKIEIAIDEIDNERCHGNCDYLEVINPPDYIDMFCNLFDENIHGDTWEGVYYRCEKCLIATGDDGENNTACNNEEVI